MKILFHILLDMNQKTKISTKFPRSKLGVATVVLSLGGVAVYSLGVINPLQASQSEYLQVDGVQNSVQYLTSLVIDSPTAKVEFKYDDASKAVRALGSLNMQNLVVGQGNESSASSVVFWWTENNNQWANSVIVWGNSTTNEGNNNVIVLSPGSNSRSENTAILNGQNVVTNGKNITVVNGETNVRGNYVTVFGNSSVAADHVVVFGDKVNNNKSNTFVFNGQDAEFVPEQGSAFYANSKVAINGDHANATLDVHGGMMIGHRKMGQSNTYTAWKNPATSGTIALFSKYGQTGLCGYDGKDNRRRVPLSESARKFWLCAPIRRIWDLPANAVSNNQKKQFPQVWNQNGRWEWESPKWIYGSKDEPQHFLCADGYVPDNADPIGKTGVKCIPCEWAKSGDLNCTTQKGDNSAATPHCPQGTNYNETSKKCEGTKSTPCVAWDNIVSFNPDTQIETYNADRWIWQVTQRCKAVKCQEGYILEGERCVKKQEGNFKCIGDVPQNAILIKWDDQGLTSNTEINLVDKNWSAKCEYICDVDNWFFRIWNRCEKNCYAGMVRDGANPKWLDNNLVEGYYYDPYKLAELWLNSRGSSFLLIPFDKFPINYDESSPRYKVPNRLVTNDNTIKNWLWGDKKLEALTAADAPWHALFIKDRETDGEYLFVRPYSSVINSDKLGKKLTDIYSSDEYTYVSVDYPSAREFYTSWWSYNTNERKWKDSTALCYYSGNRCSPTIPVIGGWGWGGNNWLQCKDTKFLNKVQCRGEFFEFLEQEPKEPYQCYQQQKSGDKYTCIVKSNIKKKDDCTKAKWYRGILDEGKSAKVDCNTRVALCDSYHQNNCIKKYIKHKCSSLKTKKECNQQPSCTWN